MFSPTCCFLWLLILITGNVVLMNFIIAVVSDNSSRTKRSGKKFGKKSRFFALICKKMLPNRIRSIIAFMEFE
jgi:regulator of extracellular matrix RemA (YlzA/DUF370 family)